MAKKFDLRAKNVKDVKIITYFFLVLIGRRDEVTDWLFKDFEKKGQYQNNKFRKFPNILSYKCNKTLVSGDIKTTKIFRGFIKSSLYSVIHLVTNLCHFITNLSHIKPHKS